ncbi:hypothetical protein DFJ73DRAFT_957867 [Zopfochytrium polystomum]|nr:hypothetical protein DFJ73DRAFT_957867 [Zopfochytrium polystomum]
MGLCKCRVVTNLLLVLFCNPLVLWIDTSFRPQCVVRSYLQWLQDSDYEAVCTVCKETLEKGELVRLCCLDVFHLKCLNNKCDQLPEHTAPAGYACPDCNLPIIPPNNVSTPLAELVRASFANAKWAQNILPKKLPTPVGETRPDPALPPPAVPASPQPATSVAVNIADAQPASSVKPTPSRLDSSDTVSPARKLTNKPSQSGLRDGDDDKYGRKRDSGLRVCQLKGRWFSARRLTILVVVLLICAWLWMYMLE